MDILIDEIKKNVRLKFTAWVLENDDFVGRDMCGFAHVHVNPARGAIYKNLVRQGFASKGVYKGYDVSIHKFLDRDISKAIGQSITAREVIATAIADVLQLNGEKAYMSSRLD